MKRPFRPIFLAALCWILVALVPATRNGLFRAWNTAFLEQDSGKSDATQEFSRQAGRRFPTDRRVKLDLLARNSSTVSPRRMEKDARELGDDPVAIAVVLQSYLRTLRHNRNRGPLTNPNFPAAPSLPTGFASPRADYDRFLALARRGQKSEPNNTFFDWMVLHGLFATRRDDEGRAVLKRAARKTGYDDHLRDLILNRLAVVRLAYGGPLSPRDYHAAWAADDGVMFSKIRYTAFWIVESAIADRSAGQHPRALDAAFDLAKMGRIMRRQSVFVGINVVGGAVEGYAINRIDRPHFLTFKQKPLAQTPPLPPKFGAPIAQLKASPFTLYSYARSQNRADITRFLDREWPELGRWRAWELAIFRQSWMGNTPRQTTLLAGAERLRALILFALPLMLISGALWTLLSRHFRDDSGASLSGFKRGAWAATLLFSLALVCDAIIAFRQDNVFTAWQWLYLDGPGLLSTMPSWITLGPVGVTTLLALNLAVRWQKKQAGGAIALKTRLKTLFDAPEDGLMRFDFSWMFGLVVKGTSWTVWLLLLCLFPALCFNMGSVRGVFGFDIATMGAALLNVALIPSLFAHFYAWRKIPRRRAPPRDVAPRFTPRFQRAARLFRRIERALRARRLRIFAAVVSLRAQFSKRDAARRSSNRAGETGILNHETTTPLRFYTRGNFGRSGDHNAARGAAFSRLWPSPREWTRRDVFVESEAGFAGFAVVSRGRGGTFSLQQ